MKVCISVPGRFHAFYLAWELFKKGHLCQLITSYPKFAVMKYGVPKSVVTSFLSHEVLLRTWDSLPHGLKSNWDQRFFFAERFDRFAAKKLKGDAEIFIGWSSAALRGLRRAKGSGMPAIVVRGSSHIIYQNKILQEEYKYYGVKTKPIHPRVIEKELQEYSEADYIQTISSFAKNTFVEQRISPEKIIMIVPGINANQFTPKKKQDNIFRVIHCGAISMRKGVHYLLKAFCELGLPNSELWLIGSVSEEMKPFLKKYSADNIFLKGPFPQSELYKYYSQGSLFCMVSLEDGFGAVILQAMACGLPVICTVNTGGPDVIRDSVDGFVIPIRDVKPLKEKIVFVYENQNKAKDMGEMARQRVRRDFSWDIYGNKIVSEYTKMLK
jgi:glycosyltransferase involved in cell wall biosynthesis